MAIKTFKCADTEILFKLGRVARFVNIERPALRKLKQLDLARRIQDMRAPPANRLEALKGARRGQWSVRVNDQYRICFRWNDGCRDRGLSLTEKSHEQKTEAGFPRRDAG